MDEVKFYKNSDTDIYLVLDGKHCYNHISLYADTNQAVSFIRQLANAMALDMVNERCYYPYIINLYDKHRIIHTLVIYESTVSLDGESFDISGKEFIKSICTQIIRDLNIWCDSNKDRISSLINKSFIISNMNDIFNVINMSDYFTYILNEYYFQLCW